jgi:signal transduction histidine kinase
MRSVGPRIGPPPGDLQFSRDGWLLNARRLPEGLILIVGFPEAQGLSARRVFVLSLLIAVPLSLLIAICVGWFVGRRVTWPIVDFTRRVAGTSDRHGLEPVRSPVPTEIRDLEGVFQDLLKRLMENVSRELEFATNASHELRTPLTAIRMNAERALRDAGPTGRQELTDQLREIDRMVKLIDSLLVMARDAQAGMTKGEVVNVADLAREIAGRVLTVGSSAHMSLPDEALVLGDENLLAIAIENLVDNARKFTTEGAPIRLSLPANGARVRLFVTSPGARIPTDKREAIFERFYRDPATRAALPGHGLGLPLSRHIARLHGGNVACVSGSEEDACFVLELPGWAPKSASLSEA